MKTTEMTTLSLVASLLCALAMHPLPAAAAGSDLDPVLLDTDGNEVVAGTEYYIVSAIRGAGGGGVMLAATGEDNDCPEDVIQSPFDLQLGLPVTISPVNSSRGDVVRLSTDSNIKFSSAPNCVSSPVWRVAEVNGYRVVTTGGEEGNPGKETVNNWFRIEKRRTFGGTYAINFCPRVCNTCDTDCDDVGIYDLFNSGLRRLVLPPGAVFPIRFVKASTSTGAAGRKLVIKKATDPVAF